MKSERNEGFVPVPGGRLYYQVMGEGHPLVLIHAGIADQRMWDDQFDEFAQHYRTVRYDLRGYGKTESEATTFSYRQDLYELLKHLHIERAHVLGLSMGGQIAVDMTLEHPEVVTALVAAAAGVSGYQGPIRTDAQAQFELERFTEMEALWQKKDVDRLVEMELEMWVDGPLQPSDRVPPRVRERVKEMDLLAFQHGTNEPTPEPLDPPAANRLGEIRVPALIIWGDLDTTGTHERCEWLADYIPGAQRIVIPGTAHMLNMEKPAEFNRAVLDFLATVKVPA